MWCKFPTVDCFVSAPASVFTDELGRWIFTVFLQLSSANLAPTPQTNTGVNTVSRQPHLLWALYWWIMDFLLMEQHLKCQRKVDVQDAVSSGSSGVVSSAVLVGTYADMLTPSLPFSQTQVICTFKLFSSRLAAVDIHTKDCFWYALV